MFRPRADERSRDERGAEVDITPAAPPVPGRPARDALLRAVENG
jgi:hypothetical protein